MNPKIIIALVLGALLLVLALQNTAEVTVQLLFWTVSMSRALLIVVAAAAGLVAGLALAGRQGGAR